VKREKEKPKPP
jgi:hypothetical protein